ncbi:MAG: acyl-CoA dehydrogenase family protein, partial [Desulfatiglandales bacterium]|nr:acyl-CoA dehydrogenase family protein [Desulfatiglandales bacterium]
AEVDAARLLNYRLGWMITEGMPAVKEAAMAKLISTETCQKVATAGMQIMGGYSFMPEMDMERHWRTSKFQTVGGGTSQIQRSIISRQLEL